MPRMPRDPQTNTIIYCGGNNAKVDLLEQKLNAAVAKLSGDIADSATFKETFVTAATVGLMPAGTTITAGTSTSQTLKDMLSSNTPPTDFYTFYFYDGDVPPEEVM